MMNNEEVIGKVSEKSGVSFEDCQKVLEAFEEVLNDELANSKDVKSAFDKVYKAISYFRR